ncbi:RasGTPase-activating protein [Dictyostelium discoideum AX4]|uniref:Ras GTPase-activating-like protein rgaA n=1 Tax=Dictyostelium discoideum TaxID=44689 RepID=RGAA_DICDI|nr:RasGTPase-activating protein [Dictyostelium discoideum AX4]Q54K32.1 RecName: Full=Ras GTPase-activating-like protein rgaA; Short=DGAP1; AltName: Full=Developmental gene 1029 protein [Dictyostelium discoideum]EAL63601.1 RasGTPase-activating protein [Dictyostelium discoideum AX4]|eukprot:XP_637132.1 RasGTPase-activating protein [Dictyostelium discoideum AX4]
MNKEEYSDISDSESEEVHETNNHNEHEHEEEDDTPEIVVPERKFLKEDEDYSVPFPVMRECLVLLLQSRRILRDMMYYRFKMDRFLSGNLSVFEIQNLLHSQREDKESDWIAEIQELKRNLVSEVRRNHTLERDLNRLDKRIALLIKNRGNIQDVLADKAGLKAPKHKGDQKKPELINDPKKLEAYQNLFYLLQTEPKYLAGLVYLIQPEQMESFLGTVILTLFGDAFTPREEFLLLSLYRLSIQKEMANIATVGDFLKADTVVPKMIITYNKRKQGTDYLKAVIGPILSNVIKQELNLELKPNLVYAAIISEQEIRTGEKSTLDRNVSHEKALEVPEVTKTIKARVDQLISICEQFLDGIISSLNRLPYGIRWICKQIYQIAEKNFTKSTQDEILKVIGYFIYYRFIQVAMVSPEEYDLVGREIHPTARKNLINVSKVLQALFNFAQFGSSEKHFIPLNGWITSHMGDIKNYLQEIIEVGEPEDYLQVDKYMELTQKTKPVIIISLPEICNTHQLISKNLDSLVAKGEKDDPMRIIMKELDEFGPPPDIAADDDREVQLTLSNKFQKTIEEELSPGESLLSQTKEMVISLLRALPTLPEQKDQSDEPPNLVDVLNKARQADPSLEPEIKKILDNLKKLEEYNLTTSADNYSSFLKAVALEVVNRAEIREQQKKEKQRLTTSLNNLRKHQKYLNEQIAQYNQYLQDCRLKHYQNKSKKKKKGDGAKVGPFKFSFSELHKKGVIVDSEVPQITRKKIKFVISSDTVGVFDVSAKMAGIDVQTMRLELDDLLELNSIGTTTLELDQITLDVNMTIHLLNKLFLY